MLRCKFSIYKFTTCENILEIEWELSEYVADHHSNIVKISQETD
jgi:hypothetical protein